MWRRAIGLIGGVLLLAGPAMGQDDQPTMWKGFCQVDQQGVKPCGISDRVSADGQHHLQFSFGGKSAGFLGRSSGPWWSGEHAPAGVRAEQHVQRLRGGDAVAARAHHQCEVGASEAGAVAELENQVRQNNL